MMHSLLLITAWLVFAPAESLSATPPVAPAGWSAGDTVTLSAGYLPVRDTLSVTADQQARISTIIPRRATIRSIILPGWGQLYNRQYWKIPVVYTGLGLAIGFYSWNSTRYGQYLAGYQEAYNAPVGEKTAIVRGEIRSVDQLKRISDQFRRQRDLTVILTVLGWALNAVEANVAAHLKTFDVSDDLAVQISPAILPGPGLVPGIRIAVTCR